MAAAAAEAAAAAGGEAMAEADGAQQMDTTDPLAYELSATLRAIAGLLQLDASGPSAQAMVAAVQRRVAELLAQLPAGFFEPLLPSGSLGDAQVWTWGAGWGAKAMGGTGGGMGAQPTAPAALAPQPATL